MMMTFNIVSAVVGVGLWDWLTVTRIGAYFTSFDYRYWPLSRWRFLSALVLAGTVAAIAVFMRPDPINPPMWPLIAGGCALAIWMTVAIRDVSAQRRVGYQTPSRYSE